MRFLADESCDFAVVRALRAAGFDVTAIAEIAPRSIDQQVIEMAVRERRILLTEDKDFGQLVFSGGEPSAGVILMRFPSGVRQQLPDTVLNLVRNRGDHIAGSFAVVQPGRIRIIRA